MRAPTLPCIIPDGQAVAPALLYHNLRCGATNMRNARCLE